MSLLAISAFFAPPREPFHTSALSVERSALSVPALTYYLFPSLMNFPSIRIEGQIFSGELLQRLDQPDMPGQRPVDFGLPSDLKVKDEIARAWADAQDYWRIFQRKLSASDLRSPTSDLRSTSTATTETRQQWIVPLLGLLGYQLEYQSRGAELNGKIYAISHRAVNRAQIPVHIVGYRDPAGLDRKPENATLRMSPHAMVQEYINLHDQLYGIVTNGATLRLLRDSFRLVRLNYLEFDLDRMFTDGLFADFAVLYRLLHATRLPQSSEATGESIIERYHQDSIEQGTRIRDGLREAVRQALEIFGTGFVSNPENLSLRDQLASGAMTPTDFFGNLLRLIYRLLFLNVVEERNLVFPEGSSAKHVNVYYTHYSVQRLRKLSRAQGVKSDRCHDAWLSLLSTFKLFERPELASKLGTTAFGGSLFNPKSLGALPSCQLDNATFFRALDCLCSFNDPATGQRQPVNFGALATEEFGSVYESLLELHTVVESSPVARFGFSQTAGNDRKTSGSYYTPSCLVNCLLDSALDPVLEERVRDYKKLGYATVDEAVLSLKVCDPACGSGHFLIAAAQRIARRLAVLRSNGEEPAPGQMRHALREVIGRCIYGVDINPMSVELCRVALWLEAIEPGKPLSFLNKHIQCGNSLLGVTPALLKRGIPDAAYEPIEGDDKKFAIAWKRRNCEAKLGQHDLFADKEETWHYQNALLAATKDIEAISDESFTDVERKESAYADYLASSSYRFGKRLHDVWCAAFVWLKKDDPSIPEPITQQIIDQMKRDPNLCPKRLAEEIDRLAAQYNFFHWHLAFPDVFQPLPEEAIKKEDILGWSGGFDCILGNPPWERVKLQEKEFFSERDPAITNAANAAERKRLIEQLAVTNPRLREEFRASQRRAEGESHMLRNSGIYPLCGRGDINLYAVFAEGMRNNLGQRGRVGCVLPSGIATDDTTKLYFQDVMEKKSLVSLFDFENRNAIFPSVHRSYKFCLFTAGGSLRPTADIAELVFFALDIEELRSPSKRVYLTADDIRLLNPTTRTCPIFRSKKDSELTKSIYMRTPCFADENHISGWQLEFFKKMVDFGIHAELIDFAATQPSDESVAIYESRLIWHYNHRFATYGGVSEHDREVGNARELNHQELTNAFCYIQPRCWLQKDTFKQRMTGRPWSFKWFLSVRDVTNATNERTAVFVIRPFLPSNDKLPSLFVNANADDIGCLTASLCSFPFDYVARQKVGGMNFGGYIIAQLPALPPTTFAQNCSWDGKFASLKSWLLSHVLELTYTAWDLEHFAKDCGYDGPPFKWDEERRFLLRCELDAAFFHLYLGSDDDWLKNGTAELITAFPTPRDAVVYIMDTFPIVKRKDEAAHGTYRTKDTILSIYDAMQSAIRTGQPYQTLLDPPPGPPVDANGNFIPIAKWDLNNWPKHIHPARNGGAHEV